MSGKYDIESLLADLLATVQANLPAKITAINAEKADGITISSVANENYYNDTSEQVFNVSPFIYYGLIDIQTKSSGIKTLMTVTINFEVVFDNANVGNTLEKVLRYSRCLREVVQESFKGSRHSDFAITELLPANAQLNQGSDFKVGGIQVTTSITG